MAASRRKQTPAEIRAGLERARTDAAWSAARHEARRLKATGADAEARRFTEDVTDEHGRKHRKSFIGVAGERKDVFKLLLERSAIEQAGFDAIRRYEADHCQALGLTTPERRPDHIRATVAGAPGQNVSDAMVQASRRAKWVEDRLTDRNRRMLAGLLLNSAHQWRAIVQMHTGEQHDKAQAAVVRALADAVRDAHAQWDRSSKKAA